MFSLLAAMLCYHEVYAHSILCAIYAVLGSQGIVVKCTAAIFFSYGGMDSTVSVMVKDSMALLNVFLVHWL